MPNISANSLIVMDNAPYHSRRLEPVPTGEFVGVSTAKVCCCMFNIAIIHNFIFNELPVYITMHVYKHY